MASSLFSFVWKELECLFLLSRLFFFFFIWYYPAGKVFHNQHSQPSLFCQGTIIAPLGPKREGVQTKENECTLVVY